MQVEQHRAGSSAPVLLLAREDTADALDHARAIGATAVLPAGVSDAQILFTAKQLAATHRSTAHSGSAVDPAVEAAVREACACFDWLFSAARGGRALEGTDLERGGVALLAAVRQGQIGDWLDVVRAHDDSTYQHCLLVSGLAVGFAIQLGMTPSGQRLIARAALVHDIGKAAIPRSILTKAGPLTGAEMEVMRTHPAVGHRLLARQGGFDPRLLDIVRHHHEYLDGSGYPDGLRNAQLSPMVRLATICDIYAALIERRPYKKPMSSRDALTALGRMGDKLDVSLLRTFAGMASRMS